MAYEMKDGERMALMCLESHNILSVPAVHQAIKRAYDRDDPRTAFHLDHLVYVGLAEKVPGSCEETGYILTELGVRATNEVVINRRRTN